MLGFLKNFNKKQLTQFVNFSMGAGKKGAKPAGEKPAATEAKGAAKEAPAKKGKGKAPTK